MRAYCSAQGSTSKTPGRRETAKIQSAIRYQLRKSPARGVLGHPITRGGGGRGGQPTETRKKTAAPKGHVPQRIARRRVHFDPTKPAKHSVRPQNQSLGEKNKREAVDRHRTEKKGVREKIQTALLRATTQRISSRVTGVKPNIRQIPFHEQEMLVFGTARPRLGRTLITPGQAPSGASVLDHNVDHEFR